MLKMAMSGAASGLLRALLERIGDQSDRILLSEIQSVDWQSLTFTGETHVMRLRVPGPNADQIVGRLTAVIAVAGAPVRALDGSVTLAIEALTIAE